MKKLLLIITLLLAALGLAQCGLKTASKAEASAEDTIQKLEFLDIAITRTPVADFHKELLGKSFSHAGAEGQKERFTGYFEGVSTTVLVEPDADGNIEKVTVTLFDPDKEKMHFIAERVDNELHEKYWDYERYINFSEVESLMDEEGGGAVSEKPGNHLLWNHFRKKENGKFDYISFGEEFRGDYYHDSLVMVIVYCPDTNKLDF